MQTNNKIRAALEQAKEIARTIYSTSETGSPHEDLAEKIVELAHAALAEPVRERKPKSARWAGIEYHYAVCSKCGGQVGTGFETTADAVAGWTNLYPFCPYCGTPMQSSEYDGPGARQYRSRKEGGAK